MGAAEGQRRAGARLAQGGSWAWWLAHGCWQFSSGDGLPQTEPVLLLSFFELLLLVYTSCDVHTPSLLFPSRSKPVARHTRTAPLRIMKQKASRREKVLPASSTFGASMPVPSPPATSTSNPPGVGCPPMAQDPFFLFFFPVHLHLARSHSRPPISTIPCNSAAICSQLDSVHETQRGGSALFPTGHSPETVFFSALVASLPAKAPDTCMYRCCSQNSAADRCTRPGTFVPRRCNPGLG